MSGDTILARAREFLATVSAQYAADGYYERLPLNTFWAQQNLPIMHDIIATSATPANVVRRAQQTFMFSVNVATSAKERAVDWLLAEQAGRGVDLSALAPAIQESEFSHLENNATRGGRRLTPDFIRTVNIGLNIDRHFRHDGRTLDIVELGGGLGHLARTLRLLGVARSHLIIDLPETLVFSFCFLSLNFPTARMLLVTDEASARRIANSDYDFAFVPALFSGAASTRPYDLFVNTASLGEMRNEAIRHWMDFVQNRLNVRYLYTLNRYLNTIDPSRHAWRLAESECSLLYDRRWEILQWELEPPFTRCPYVDTVIARYVEIAAARLAADAGDDAGEAERLLQSVREEDWYSAATQPPDMTLRDHVIGCDLGLTGTLFKLWNSLRLRRSAECLEVMLRYLDRLLTREDRIFEEQPYYEELFFSLLNPAQDALEDFARTLRQRRRRRARRSLPVLIESAGSFNIVQVGEDVLAVATTLGPVRFFEERLGERSLPPLLFTTSSLEEARCRIVGLEPHGAGVLETRHGFNVMWGGNGFYGLRQGTEGLDISKAPGAVIEEARSGDVVFGEQITTVRDKIDALEAKEPECGPATRRLDAVEAQLETLSPDEFLGSWRGYNLLRHRGAVIALSQGLGEMDLSVGAAALVERYGGDKVILAQTAEIARIQIDLLALMSEMRDLRERFGRTFMRKLGRFVGVRS